MTWGHADSWREAVKALALEVEAPFRLDLPTGVLEAELLLRHFGHDNGILIVRDYETVRPHRTAMLAAGYTLSSFDPPPPGQPLSRGDVIELLADWGWSGPPERRPDWLPAA